MKTYCTCIVFFVPFLLRVDRSDQIGMGNFSVVFRGLVKSRQQFVAIKCPLTTADTNQFKAMLLEIKIMVHIGKHENILALIGACTDSIQQSLFQLYKF